MKTLYLCGAGNSEGVRLALAVNEKESRWDKIALLDDDPTKHGKVFLGVRVFGPIEMLADAPPHSSEVANLVARSTAKRLAVRRKIEQYGLPFPTLVHPTVDTSGVELEDDVLLYQNAVIGPEVSIRRTSCLFMGAIVGHESHLGRCVIMAPGAIINARIEVEDGVYFGTNSSVLPEVRIGAWATVGAGSVVMRNVPAGATMMGVPGKIVWRVEPEPELIDQEPSLS